MSGKSPIEWTEHTWNPIVGCSLKSPGCVHCYAMPMAARIEAINAALVADGKPPQSPQYDGTTKKVNGHAVWTGKLAMAGDNVLLAPLKRKKPTTYFVNSMGDLFHEACPDEWIDRVFAVMALCPQHTFQVLTKRAARMRDYFLKRRALDVHPLEDRELAIDRAMNEIAPAHWCDRELKEGLPLPNVWLGVSTERQQEADERIPLLLQTPAAIRFISAEPLLGPIDIERWLHIAWQCSRCEHLFAGRHKPACPECGQVGGWTGSHAFNPPRGQVGAGLDWVIVGGESGPNARPMHPDWARGLRDQCAAAGVDFFFKQWGNWRPEINRDRDDPDWRQPYSDYREPHFQMLNLAGGCGFHGERLHVMRRYSKKSAGKLLDGVAHQAMPRIGNPGS